ncbi:unnamed protein product [Clonostachys byssicola]|uniref:Uncharacterized protein n=1 Tax=Clonostachys byssicola TaxID=160290 RepID=A0A9N9YB10_9HYPO|nr:unnamed protein product [Clonostachys byssicola]
MAEAARIHKDRAILDFETFKGRWRWVYDRLTNAMVLTEDFKLKNSHDGISKEVNTWSPEKHVAATSIAHQVHGTAMYYGFTNGNEEFDLEQYIDLSLCAISVESLFTNKMKWDFRNDYVPDMQEDLVKIPLSHTHYKIDPAVGDTI